MEHPRINFELVDWPRALHAFGMDDSFISKREGPCPLCGGTKRFRFRNDNNLGNYWCNSCGSGMGFTLLRRFTNLPDWEIMQKLSALEGGAIEVVGAPIKPLIISDEFTPEQVETNRKRLNRTRQGTRKLTESCPVVTYLKSRIPRLDWTKISGDIRIHPALEYWEEDDNKKYHNRGKFPTMVATVRDGITNRPITLHRTYLTATGTKAPFEDVKKQMAGIRKLRGASIRLHDVPGCRTLGVTEGTENGYAIVVRHNYLLPVRSLINCKNMAVAEISREDYDEVIIFADHDEIELKTGKRPGTAGAEALKVKLEAEGFKVTIKMPPVVNVDYADMWVEYCKRQDAKFDHRMDNQQTTKPVVERDLETSIC